MIPKILIMVNGCINIHILKFQLSINRNNCLNRRVSIILYILSAVIWVDGVFLRYMCLRRACVKISVQILLP